MFKNNKRFKIFEPMKILGLVLRIKEKDQPLKIPNISLEKLYSKIRKYHIKQEILLIYIFFISKKIYLKCLTYNLKFKKPVETLILLSNKYFGFISDSSGIYLTR